MIHDFLPVCRADMEKRGWDQCDFVYVCGDAYVDHPSFGSAIISRVLESYGYKVGIIAQPDWKDKESIQVLGRPRLGFLVSAGNMDSMVNHYSVSKRRRDKDSYTPGGVMGKRPDYAAVVYCNLIRSVYKDIPIVIGGIEASLRRLAHYDYWSNKVKHSILVDSQADLISYGMGEKSIVEIADALNSGLDVKDITFIDGTVYKTDSLDSVYDAVTLPSYDEIKTDKRRYAESFNIQYKNTDAFSGKRLVEQYRDNLYVVQNPPAKPLSVQEMDDVYALPYMRRWHPSYAVDGVIPPSVKERLIALSEQFRIYVLTADTHGNAKAQCEGLPVILETFPTGNAKEYKRELVKATGAKRCVAIGNGRNDEWMLKEAALSIAVMDREGVYGKLLKNADLCVRSMQDGLDLLLYPGRIIAGLRG